MKSLISGNTVEIQDTGAPRGEKNHWEVKLNGVPMYEGYNGAQANRMYDALMAALHPTQVNKQH